MYRFARGTEKAREDAAVEGIIKDFVYLSKHEVIVCSVHGYAVQNLRSHLDAEHPSTTSVRRRVVDHFASCKLCSPQDLVVPEPGGPPLSCLAEPKKGYVCEHEGCGFISIDRGNIATHCRAEHQWQSSVEKRGPWHEAAVQRFYTLRRLSKYFIVDDEIPQPKPAQTPEVRATELSRLEESWDKLISKQCDERDFIQDDIAAADNTGWWKRTGWVEHLAGSNMKHLTFAARLPDKQEPELNVVCDLIEILMEQNTQRLLDLPRMLRRWMRSARPDAPDERSMARLHNKNTYSTYMDYWKRLICYTLRIYIDVNQLDGGIGMVDLEPDTLYDARRLYPWARGQQEVADSFWQTLVNQAPEAEQLEALQNLSDTFIFHHMPRGELEYPLIHFLAVLGIDAECERLRLSHEFSPILSGMQYNVRILAVGPLSKVAEGEEDGEVDCRLFLAKRNEYLCDNLATPMSTVNSLLAYSRSIGRDFVRDGLACWLRGPIDAMSLYGKKIAMKQFQDMVSITVTETEDLLWKELMWTSACSERIAINLSEIEDDPSICERGASFVTQEQNGFKCQSREMLQHLVSGDKPILRGRDGSWRIPAIREYLRQVYEFKPYLLICVHITSGQPARASELSSMRFRNGQLQCRNIYILGSQVMTVSRCHNSQALSESPELIPRFLPSRVAQLLVVYLIYVQPFAEFLSAAIAEPDENVMSDYVWGEGDECWDSTELSTTLDNVTARHLGVRFKIHDYRHTALLIGQRFVGSGFGYTSKNDGEIAPQDQYDDEARDEFGGEAVEDPLDMQRAPATSMGDDRYAMRSDMVKGLTAKSIDFFRDLSEGWHKFLQLDSDETRKLKRPLPLERKEKTSHGGKQEQLCKRCRVTENKASSSTVVSDQDIWRSNLQETVHYPNPGVLSATYLQNPPTTTSPWIFPPMAQFNNPCTYQPPYSAAYPS